MNFAAVVRAIESLTGHRVNARLRAYLQNFPFPQDSRMVARDWVLTPQRMIEELEKLMLEGRAGYPWPPHFLPVGGNDNPDYYCVDLREDSLNIYQDAYTWTAPEFVRVDTFENWLQGAWEEERSLIEEEAEED